MRYQGKITDWKDDQGFGFISPNGGGRNIFFHIKSFATREKRPGIGQLVNYEVHTDEKGRLNATNVSSVKSTKEKPTTIGKSIFPVLFTLTFLLFMCISVALGARSILLLAIYAATSFITFYIYWQDKRAAKIQAQRTPEKTLHILSLLGGWPGGLFAQRIIRHKSTKKSFQYTYWLTVFINIGLLALYPSLLNLLK